MEVLWQSVAAPRTMPQKPAVFYVPSQLIHPHRTENQCKVYNVWGIYVVCNGWCKWPEVGRCT